MKMLSLSGQSVSGTTIRDSPMGNTQHSYRVSKDGSFPTGRGRFVLLVCISVIALGFGVAVQGYLYLSRKIPSVEKLKNYELRAASQVFADNGDLIGEFYTQRRYVVPIQEKPQALQDACWAMGGEEHIKASLFRSLSRTKPKARNQIIQKVEAALLWNRIDKTLTKERVLCLYMNEVYLGNGAFGVEAAARTYFGKNVKDLTIAECATIVSLADDPYHFSPIRKPQAALERRNHVLQRMWKNGKIAQAEYDKARHEEPVLVEKTNRHREKAADFLQHVREYIENKYGAEVVYQGGLSVYTTFDLASTETVQEAMPLPTFYIRRIVDKRGRVLEENRSVDK